MAYLAFWLQFSKEAPEVLAALLCRPALDALTRTAMVDRDRRKDHQEKTPAGIEAQLRAPDSQGVDLDSGRGRDLDAGAVFFFDRAEDAYPIPHQGNITLPYDPASLDDLIETFSDFVCGLEAGLAYFSLEPSFEEAENTALGFDTQGTRARTDISAQRRRERLALTSTFPGVRPPAPGGSLGDLGLGRASGTTAAG